MHLVWYAQIPGIIRLSWRLEGLIVSMFRAELETVDKRAHDMAHALVTTCAAVDENGIMANCCAQE